MVAGRARVARRHTAAAPLEVGDTIDDCGERYRIVTAETPPSEAGFGRTWACRKAVEPPASRRPDVMCGVCVRRLRRRVRRGRRAIALEPHRRPAVSAVAAFPELAVGEAGEEATVGGAERVRHRRERFGQPAGEWLPRFGVASPVDACLWVATAVGGVGAGTRRQVPALQVVRVDGYRPGVVAVAALVGWLPGFASVRAEGGAAPAS